jgi:hypothetical protein
MLQTEYTDKGVRKMNVLRRFSSNGTEIQRKYMYLPIGYKALVKGLFRARKSYGASS